MEIKEFAGIVFLIHQISISRRFVLGFLDLGFKEGLYGGLSKGLHVVSKGCFAGFEGLEGLSSCYTVVVCFTTAGFIRALIRV